MHATMNASSTVRATRALRPSRAHAVGTSARMGSVTRVAVVRRQQHGAGALRSAAGVHAVAARRAARVRRTTAVVVQANLFGRLVRVIQSYVSSFTSSFEDPELLLDRCMQEMQEDLIKMRQATAKVTASSRQVERQYQAQQQAADEWLRRAQLAVNRGEDELARQALMRRKAFEQAAQTLKVQVDAQVKAREQLTANMRMLEGKLAEAANKRESLKARAASAKSSKQIQEFIGGLKMNTSTAWAAFDKMEEKVMALEAEAESSGILATPDGLEAKFIQLEGGVEDELTALKRGLLAPSSTASKEAGSKQSNAQPLMRDVLVKHVSSVDYELEELRRQVRKM